MCICSAQILKYSQNNTPKIKSSKQIKRWMSYSLKSIKLYFLESGDVYLIVITVGFHPDLNLY